MERLGKNNPRVSFLRKLVRSPSACRSEGVVIIEGPKLLEEAVRSGLTIQLLLTTQDSARDRGAQAAFVVDEALMESLSDTAAPQGLLAVATRPEPATRQTLQRGSFFVAVGVQDPGNVGALLRVVLATGMSGLAVDHASADPLGPKAVRGSAGAAFRVPVLRVPDAGKWLTELEGVTPVATIARGGTSVFDADLSGKVAFLLGGEGGGLPAMLVESVSTKLSLPMEGQLESLNVSVAAAIVAYESWRQRGLTSSA